MPKVSFYLRNEDVAQWKAIKLKTEFIHSALVEAIETRHDKPEYQPQPPTLNAPAAPTPPKSPAEIAKNVARDIRFCKNGHLLQQGRTKCSAKGCKYS